MKWKMIDYVTFAGVENGIEATVRVGGALGCPYWCIMKDGVIVEDCYSHSPISSSSSPELAAKAKVEREIKKHLPSPNDAEN